ncbi:serine/threonine-protein kinase [Lentisphaera profundi]|uniref:Serine/threonine-protein kinase n=1 Tax=Lentisphaera profundi TaxID=1658616 RepID=A0ABY7VTF9_9BACT|nr:serine/threonine-protein kinase [Lentisphaera profundi]WDE95428.1 serine/threonine-protein kinase [Lentisphaera profundi]
MEAVKTIYNKELAEDDFHSSSQDHDYLDIFDKLPDLNDRYRVRKIIGRGGNSTIVKARDLQLGRSVALKILKDQYKKKVKVSQRFINEALIMAYMQHPGIIPVYNLGKIGNNDVFYSMPIISGKTLREIYDEKNLKDLLKIFKTTCHTLAYAHEHNIIHRDIKPENIMVDEYERVLLLDWGLARNLNEQEPQDDPMPEEKELSRFEDKGDIRLTMNGEISGTPAYMAPEQTLGLGRSTNRGTDVFAMGIILYEILYGTHPFTNSNSTNFRQIFNEIKNTTPSFPKRGRGGSLIHPTLAKICRRCLHKIPDNRYQDAIHLSEELDNFHKKVKKNALIKALVLVCLFALCSSVTIFLYLNSYKSEVVNKDMQMLCMLLNRSNPSDEALNAVRLKLQMHKNDLHKADKNNLKFIVGRLQDLSSKGIQFESSLKILEKGASLP